MIFILARAATYSALFVGVLLVFLPNQVLVQTGISRPASFGAVELAGAAVVVFGSAIALWCILSFVVIGRGTPAPFDPPRQLVVRGPYRFVRNPMYIGAGLALLGAAIFYRSVAMVGYVLVLWMIVQLLVVFYEEPTLRRSFGAEYEAYLQRVHRWLPHR